MSRKLFQNWKESLAEITNEILILLITLSIIPFSDLGPKSSQARLVSEKAILSFVLIGIVLNIVYAIIYNGVNIVIIFKRWRLKRR